MPLPRTYSWTVFIFGYNEERTVASVIDQTVAVLREITTDFSVTVIDDGSRDGTLAAVRQAAARHPEVRIVQHPVNRGIGGTLAEGYRLPAKEVVCGLPADGEFAVECLRAGAQALREADIVCFFRQGRRSPLVRRALTRAHGLLNRWLLGLNVRDVNWVKIYKRWVLAGVPASSQSPLIDTKLLAQARRQGARIVELPSPFRARAHRGGAGMSGTLRNAVVMTGELLAFCLRFRFGSTPAPAKPIETNG